MYKKFTIGLLIGLLLAIGVTILAAPVSNILRNVLPESTDLYDLGTTTARWNRIFMRFASSTAASFSGDVYVGSTATTTISSTATSTFLNGITLTTGCFRDPGGSCVGGGGGTPGGSDTQIQYNNASSFGGISGFIFNGTGTINSIATNTLQYVDIIRSTSTQATSTSLYVSGAMNLASGIVYRIDGTSVLSATTLGSGITGSSLTSVGALGSGSISAGFGAIDIGTDALTAGATSITTLTATGLSTLTGGILANNSTSTIVGLTIVNSTTTSATTTNLYVSGATTTRIANGITLVDGCFAIGTTCIGGGGGTPGGSNTQLQYNNSSAFGGISGFIFNGTGTINSIATNTLQFVDIIRSTSTQATTTNLSSTLASTTNLTISGLGNSATRCLNLTNQGVVGIATGDCGTSSPTATVPTERAFDTCSPQISATTFAPGGAFYDFVGDYPATHMLNATSSRIICTIHISATTTATRVVSVFTSTTTGIGIIDIYATSTRPSFAGGSNPGSLYGALTTSLTVLLNASSTAASRIDFAAATTNFPGIGTTTPTTITLNTGDNFIVIYERSGTNASDTVENGIFFLDKASGIAFDTPVN